jgi:hypothetical protein
MPGEVRPRQVPPPEAAEADAGISERCLPLRPHHIFILNIKILQTRVGSDGSVPTLFRGGNQQAVLKPDAALRNLTCPAMMNNDVHDACKPSQYVSRTPHVSQFCRPKPGACSAENGDRIVDSGGDRSMRGFCTRPCHAVHARPE